MLSINEIKKILPHRYPFLLVDKVIEVEPGKSIKAVKNVTMNEPFFQGHFPEYPIMPGVLIVEALAQTAGIMMVYQSTEFEGKLGVFAGIDEIKFRKQVVPGDVLHLQAELVASKRGIVKAKVTATVDEKVAAEGVITFAMIKP